jgi:HAD superfamily hydrolase (TIGR01459 family)
VSIRLLAGLASLADSFDGFVVDVWGVLHDGTAAYPHAIDCLQRLRQTGKRVVLLSNASRRAEALAGDLAALGIAPSLYDHVLTSGESTWLALRDRRDPWHAALGRRCLYLGPRTGKGRPIDGLDLELVASPADADFILAGRIFRSELSLAEHDALLVEAAQRGLPMLCANPDLEAMFGDERILCPGTLARRYEEMGGEVFYHGKPHPAIYRWALGLLGIADAGRVAGIGDALHTDVAGAIRSGLGSVLVAGGVHAADLGPWPPPAAHLARLCANFGWVPDACIPALRWD